jgi:hypothetical protein
LCDSGKFSTQKSAKASVFAFGMQTRMFVVHISHIKFGNKKEAAFSDSLFALS